MLDYENETLLEDVLAAIERPSSRVGAALSCGGEAEVFDLVLDGVRLTLLPTAFSRPERAPNNREAALFLDLADQVLDRFQPEILLTTLGVAHGALVETRGRDQKRQNVTIKQL